MNFNFLIPSGVTTPPLPPQNWNGLSLDELKQMEESGRRGVEARLQCLRNIHTLMDASVILMQQYITSASIAAATSVATAAPSSTDGSSAGGSDSTPRTSAESR